MTHGVNIGRFEGRFPSSSTPTIRARSEGRSRLASFSTRDPVIVRISMAAEEAAAMTPSNEPIRYMERTRLYYRALGYEQDCVWAHYADVPFARSAKPLAECRIALVTTASRPRAVRDDGGVAKQVWSGSVAPPPEGCSPTTSPGTRNPPTRVTARASCPSRPLSLLAREGRFASLAAHSMACRPSTASARP